MYMCKNCTHSNEGGTMKNCNDCISRLICPTRGRTCDGFNNKETFKCLLMMISPNTDWSKVLKFVEDLQKESADEEVGEDNQ